jgi:uncharacterized alkaline shock family protein YloU
VKVLARLVLVLLGLLLIGTGLYILAVSADLDLAGGAALAGLADKPVLAAIGAGFLLAGLILISLGFRSPKKTPGTVLQVSEFGEIRIAIVAIENMVLRVVQQNKGVRDISRRVFATPQGLVINMRLRVVPDLQLPDLISELQGKVKSHIEEITGIFVQEVKVMVENIVLDQVPVKVK